MTSWLLSIGAILPFALTFFAYWRGLHTAQRLLPKERRANGDNRVVPDLYSPETSHRWIAIVVGEKTGNYSRRLRRSLAQARVALVLLPLAFAFSAVLMGYVPRDEPNQVSPTFDVLLPQ